MLINNSEIHSQIEDGQPKVSIVSCCRVEHFESSTCTNIWESIERLSVKAYIKLTNNWNQYKLVMIKEFIVHFIQILARVLSYLPAAIYGYFYSEYFTKATYKRIAERNEHNPKNVLDIGTATGQPLYSIIDSFKNAKVVGIDIDKSYVPACQKLFINHSNVTIKLMNFYDLDLEFPDTQFDTIIFGSSFMLMPDQSKALELAKKHLTRNGKIFFLLTLYEEKSQFNRFMEIVKPYLKYLTTIDFGKVTYKSDFESYLDAKGLKCTLKQRCSGNFFLKYFKFFMYEAQTAI